MSRLEKLNTLQTLVGQLIAEEVDASGIVLGSAGTDDPMTSPLTAEGAWIPPYLARAVRATVAQNPDLYGPEQYDFASGTTRSRSSGVSS